MCKDSKDSVARQPNLSTLVHARVPAVRDHSLHSELRHRVRDLLEQDRTEPANLIHQARTVQKPPTST